MTVLDRYQITDCICGLVCTERSKSDAFEAAQHHASKGEGNDVTVYDLMAHLGGWEGCTDGGITNGQFRLSHPCCWCGEQFGAKSFSVPRCARGQVGAVWVRETDGKGVALMTDT